MAESVARTAVLLDGPSRPAFAAPPWYCVQRVGQPLHGRCARAGAARIRVRRSSDRRRRRHRRPHRRPRVQPADWRRRSHRARGGAGAARGRACRRQLSPHRGRRLRHARTVPDVRRGVDSRPRARGGLRGARAQDRCARVVAAGARDAGPEPPVRGRSGVAEAECRDLIQSFFRERRQPTAPAWWQPQTRAGYNSRSRRRQARGLHTSRLQAATSSRQKPDEEPRAGPSDRGSRPGEVPKWS